MIQHTLTEHLPYEVELPDRVLRALADRYRDQVEVRFGGTTGRWLLVAKSFVGTIRVDEHQFLIRPKVPLENLLALMDIEVASETWQREVVGLAEDPDLLAVMARLFCVACEGTTRRGVRRSYVEQRERLISPRGRIDLREIVRKPGTLTPMPCVFDEHTANNQLNQILRAALQRARRVPALGAAWQRRLLVQLAELEDVDDVRGQDWSWVQRWEPAPMEQHYATAVRLAHMLLTGSSIKSQFGGREANTFLLNMNLLFEGWIGRRLSEFCREHDVTEQDRLDLDIDGQVKLKPDLVVRDRTNRVVAVADVKYKKLHPDGDGRNPDYYQALAYATAFALDEAWLIYARLPGDVESKDVVVRNVGIELHTFGVDLSGPIEGAVHQVRQLADRLLRNQAGASGRLSI